jgi:hypothetical protein
VAEALRTAIDDPDELTSATVDSPLWQGVQRVTLQAPTVGDVQAHRLDALAVEYWPSAGRSVPVELVDRVATARRMALAAPLLLRRVRAACRGPLVLMKGPEVAACYERAALRPYGDLDILVPDARAVHRELVEASFIPVGDAYRFGEDHHLRPLFLRGVPLLVEIHSNPRWIDGLVAPSTDEILKGAVSSVTGVDGILAPGRAHHALLLAAHAWRHQPLGLLAQLADVAAVRDGLPTEELREIATQWGVSRLWNLTTRAIDALFLSGANPWHFRVWARNLPRSRERTMLELHLERWLAGFSALPAGAAAAAAGRAIAEDLRREPGERWARKLQRSSLSVRNAFRRKSLHDAEVDARYGGGENTRRSQGGP